MPGCIHMENSCRSLGPASVAFVQPTNSTEPAIRFSSAYFLQATESGRKILESSSSLHPSNRGPTSAKAAPEGTCAAP
jgi:hypothetical protein